MLPVKKLVIENLLDINNAVEMQFYTKFEYELLEFVVNIFGDEVNNLKYYPDKKFLQSCALRLMR